MRLGVKKASAAACSTHFKHPAGLTAWGRATLKIIWDPWQKVSQTQRRFTLTLTGDMVVTAPGRLDVSF